MKWFSGINTHNKKLYIDYINMYKVAVITAKKTNPNLEPYLILDGEIDESINYLIDLGVKVIKHRLTFYDNLVEHYKDDSIALGAFLRIDIPKICYDLKFDNDYILYTDNDVMFINNISSLNELKPNFFMCAGEFDKYFTPMSMNSGVLWINWRAMYNDHDNFVSFIKNNLHNFRVYDQDALKLYYNNRLESFDFNYNYKPYWGDSNDIKILHFHGPKPTYSVEDFDLFPYPSLITPYFKEQRERFIQILENS